MSIRELAEKFRSGEATPRAATEEFLQKITSLNPALNAFLSVEEGSARSQASEMTIQQNDSVLAGIPASIKDAILTKGITTTASSKILENYVAAYDATAVARLKQQKMILLGKNNCDEFAMGASNEQSAFGVVRNPYDLDRVPGGSSGGSAAAVSAGMAMYALGSDTGGSIRQPAAFCGIVGLKPTYGRVSRYGLMALCSSFDCVGPLTQTVEDAAIVLSAIAGLDSKDMTTSPQEVPIFSESLTGDIRGLKIGVPKEYFVDGLDRGVEKAVRSAMEQLEKLGAELVEVSLPHTRYAVPTYYVILPAEASSNLARYDGMRYGLRSQSPDQVLFQQSDSPTTSMSRLLDTYLSSRSEGFGAEPKRRIMIGTFVLSSGYADAYYRQAQKVRELIRCDFDRVFEQVDCLVTPTTPCTAFKIGEKVDDPVKMYLQDIFTVSANIAGIPAISVPCGFASDLPVGMQIIGKAFDESTVLRVAHAYESTQEWKNHHPNIDGERRSGV